MTLVNALRIRRNVLLAFERAENESDPAVRRRLMTIVVVGGGPTGVELAGALAELARRVARTVRRELDAPASARPARPPFRFRDKGTMATIGRSAAVAKLGPWKFGGFLAWLAWLFVHLVFLIGFGNKLTALVQWAYSYLTYKRGARIIVPGAETRISAPVL